METEELIRLDKDTMSVPEMRKILGLGKTESYWILKHRNIETVTINGKIRVVKSSFEDWYARQVKYRKTDGTPPGRLLKEDSYSVRELYELLKVSDEVIYDRIKSGELDAFECDHQLRVPRESFEKWYAVQDKHRLPDDRAADDILRKRTYSLQEAADRMGADRDRVFKILSSGKYGPQCEFISVAGHRRVTIESFDAWFSVQTRYKAKEPVAEEPRVIIDKREPTEEIREKSWYRVDEAAKLTGINRRKLYRMAENLEIRTFRAGSFLLIPAEDVKRLMNQGKGE